MSSKKKKTRYMLSDKDFQELLDECRDSMLYERILEFTLTETDNPIHVSASCFLAGALVGAKKGAPLRELKRLADLFVRVIYKYHKEEN